jgi:predicted small lipoprotein YifL
MKKIVSSAVMLSLVSVMLFGLVGCGQKEPAVETPPVVEAPVVSDEPEVLEDVETQKVPVGLAEIVNTLKSTLGESYLPNYVMGQEEFNALTGLTSDMYEEFYAEVPMIGTHVDKLFVVRTTDVPAVKEAFEAYKTAQIEDAMQYPMNKVKVENAVVTSHEDFVFYYILGGYNDEIIEDETKTPEELEAMQAEAETAWAVEANNTVAQALDALFTVGYDDTTYDFYGEMMAAMTPVEGEATEAVEGETTEPVEGETTEVTEPVEGEATEVVEGEAVETTDADATEVAEGEVAETTETVETAETEKTAE